MTVARPCSPHVKICGLSTPDAVEAALGGDADLVGFVFFPRSPRHVTVEAAAVLAGPARGRAGVVALLVDPDDAALDAVVAGLAPDIVQLHGREPPERVAAVRARFGLPVMKAVGVSSRADVERAAGTYAGVADRLLFDAKPPPGAALPGGNGVSFDRTILADLDPAVPFMLSGGLAPGTVAEAIRVTGAPGVDVSSGVESAPGRKDPALIQAFLTAVRQHR